VDEIRVIVGYGEKLVRSLVEPMGAVCMTQSQQLGTADAVRSAQPDTIEGDVIILNGDHPLLRAQELKTLLAEFREGNDYLSVVTCELKNPKSFGRIVRHQGALKAIVEAKDASAETLKIKEVNTGIYLVKADILKQNLKEIKNNNSKGEYYLTDLISICNDKNQSVGAIRSTRRVAFGVNSQEELAKASQVAFLTKAKNLMNSGVIIVDPKNTYIEDTVEIGEATVVYPGVYIRGNTKIGKYAVIESNSVIQNSTLADGVVVKAMSHLEESVVAHKAQLGPYARLRPGADIGEDVRIGNFVEIKKAKLGKGTKVGHLSYLGDAELGRDVNVGCGTITCNYAVDKKKYKTKIGDNVFVGSDTQFVAPVEIGDEVIIGSGSTITKDVPAKSLAVARAKQIIKENYKPKKKLKD
ncbi:MAG: bifunctional UDP-N-acetylglucosamine diphosphorylase/glucosamine-1-phosphate N-acetyltransferase GlmU, partial [Bdellovibrionales bacterium]|nr:bifunctional UDP-N-acetylglucosamine diphosphorylase/glucosamine-1-phosphate N-acetyltransferase GlmU [Bdellovibrionales bacterium]